MSRALIVTKKELASYFSSPTAFIFLGTYLLVSLFTFFWVEKFFSRNIADLRPLFEWMPVLLIFLIATLTMKMWSEERRAGTIEFLLSLPLKTHELVIGKFLACMALVATALALTFGLAISVRVLGDLDWGPAIGAYLASLLLASAYTAIGLYISSKTESQIVSLILTVLLCGLLYILGSDLVVGFFGNKSSEILKMIGSGSRFGSIARGIIDFRDIYYYVSIAALFLVANAHSLERLKWATVKKPKYTHMTTVLGLLVVNLIFANVWLVKVNALRIDLTQDRMYSVSSATREVIEQLEEPLLIRGYFSSRTHPLLAPLVPAIRDMLQEVQLVSKGKIRAEFIDPNEHENIEAEARRKYNIEPVPFQLGDRYSASIVNSYFNIVVQYGDQHEVLGFNDLIEIKHDGMGDIKVLLRNLEYDLARSMKKTMQAFKNTDNFFANLKDKVKFVGYFSSETLPKQLKKLDGEIREALKEYEKNAGGKFEVAFVDPSKDQAVAKSIADGYGFAPQSMSLFAQETFYFYPTLQYGDKVFSLGVPEDLSITGFKTSLDATLKRLAPGFLRTVGVVTPPAQQQNPMMAQFGGGGGQDRYRAIRQKLEENYSTTSVSLDSGIVPGEVDVLLVVAPKELNDKQVFAIDQFLMKGGTVILASSGVAVSRQGQAFASESRDTGLEKWLAHQGIDVPKDLVLDKKNSGFPAMRKRNVGGMTVREPYLAPYPFFVDVRGKGLNTDNGITSALRQVTMAWSSPVLVDAEKNKDRTVTPLIKSSEESWRSSNISIEANFNEFPEVGFAEDQTKAPSTLAVMVEGAFTSYFKGKESPLLSKPGDVKDEKGKDGEKTDEHKEGVVTSVIDHSPNIARLIVFASNEFVADETLQISGMLSGTQYVNPLQVVENSLDWSTADRALLAIRSRGHFARTLDPLTDDQRRNWEIINYGLALLGLLGIYLAYRMQRRRSLEHFKALKHST